MQCIALTYRMFPWEMKLNRTLQLFPALANIFAWQLCEHHAAQVIKEHIKARIPS